METELKILLKNGFISRRQLRELLSKNISNRQELEESLLGGQYLELPDWKEAKPLLHSGPESEEEVPPESENPVMIDLLETARKVAVTDTTILILGESGVGKTRISRMIHMNSPRRNGPFVTVSCGSIPETLLESELFGVEKGAYTGAVKSREGRFQKAHTGTIFLDEIGELSPGLQVKLLRVIQEKKIEPLGSSEEILVDVRLIAATNRNLEEDVAKGRFREDLYFRLNVVPLTMLPLRDRKEDIIPLTRYFLSQYRNSSAQPLELEEGALIDVLKRYSWPGNIRELQNCMERMAVLARGGKLRATDLPPRILNETKYRPEEEKPARPAVTAAKPHEIDEDSLPILNDTEFPSMRRIEEHYIKLALKSSSGNIYRAAEMLKIHRNTLSRKLEELGIDPGEFKNKRKSSRNMA